MSLLIAILSVAAFILCLLAGLGVPDSPRFRCGWMGVACAILAWLLMNWPK